MAVRSRPTIDWEMFDRSIKWTRALKNHLRKGSAIEFDQDHVVQQSTIDLLSSDGSISIGISTRCYYQVPQLSFGADVEQLP